MILDEKGGNKMAKILVTYVSMSGNTEEIANLVKDNLTESQHEVALEDLTLMETADLTNYDCIVIGSYTWGDGELPDEALDFYEDLDGIDLSGKKVAVFGSGDTSYSEFCEVVSTLEAKFKERGAELVAEGLKIEFTPDTNEDLESCKTFTKSILNAL